MRYSRTRSRSSTLIRVVWSPTGSARWHHRSRGTLEASTFVDLIADTPHASQLDLYVAGELAAVLALAVGPTRLRMYLPMSRRLIADVYAEQYLSEIADAFVISMDQICLQVARPLFDAWSPTLQDAVESLHEGGVALVLSGVEDLADAQRLAVHPFAELHISRRLTAAALTDADARRTATDIVRLAHERALVVGATGVDTTEHRDVLLAAGCDFASGILYGTPVPADTID